MNRRTLVLSALGFAAISVAALAFAVSNARGAVKPVIPPSERAASLYTTAAREAAGRRVLVVHAVAGKPRTAEILEAGSAPEGPSLFPGTPPGEHSMFQPDLDRAAARAAETFDPEKGFPPDVERSLDLLAVKVVALDDGGRSPRPIVVRSHAEPVMRLDSASVRLDEIAVTPARESAGWTFTAWEDDLWGGAVTVQTRAAGRFVFPYAAEGTTALVNGEPARRTDVAGLLVVDLSEGTSRVEVTSAGRGRGEALAIAGAAGLFAAIVALYLAVRPSADEVRAAAQRAQC